MVLQASDELRHESDDDFNWRESLYFNFADREHEIGAWIYLWVLPNQPMKSGMLVSVYHGTVDRLDANEVAMSSPRHLYHGPGGSWVYCYQSDVGPLLTSDFDDVELGGLRLKRVQPLERYELSFDDNEGTSFRLDCTFMTRPWDYLDGINPTPAWLATNRYHRCWWATGDIVIAGRQFSIKTTGDSDHSWGTRDREIFAKNKLKTWSLQSPDGRLSVVATELGKPGNELFIGYVDRDGEMSSVSSIQQRAEYQDTGLQRAIEIEVHDALGRTVAARMDELFGCVGGGPPTTLWGFEGAGVYQVARFGECTGIATYWWPPSVTAGQLHRGEGERWSG